MSDLCLDVNKFDSEALAWKTVITARKRLETGKIWVIILCFCGCNCRTYLEETDNLALYVSQNMNGNLLKGVKFHFLSSFVLAACKVEGRCCHWLEMLFWKLMFSDLHALEKYYLFKKKTLPKNR